MDLLDLIRRDVDELPDGGHRPGFRAVLRHIEAAEAHFARGRDAPDDTAFTDAIYRCNQAFEGSLKEAYRVLARQDPRKATTSKIEEYLQKKGIFRDRVLTQFTSYRTMWRNPSTHDYTLDFDESEALLAIMSVTAFSKLLINQISTQLVFEAVTDDLGGISIDRANPNVDPVRAVAKTLHDFAEKYASSTEFSSRAESGAHFIGSLSAYLTAALPSLTIAIEAPLGPQDRRHVDLVAIGADNRPLVIEVKRGANRLIVLQGIDQVASLLTNIDSLGGVLFVMGDPNDKYVSRPIEAVTGPPIWIVVPERVAPSPDD